MTWGMWRATVLVVVAVMLTWPIEYQGAIGYSSCGLTVLQVVDGPDDDDALFAERCTYMGRMRVVAAVAVLAAGAMAESYGKWHNRREASKAPPSPPSPPAPPRVPPPPPPGA